MKKYLLFLVVFLCGFAVKAQDLNLKNALIISNINNQQDRFSLEVTTSEIFSRAGIKNAVSLNIIKQGGDPQILLTDSIKNVLAADGINTMLLISVRGYDRKFKASTRKFTLAEDLAAENMFSLYKEEITSVTLEYHFYRNNELVYSDLLKIGGVSSREGVMKKMSKKLTKRLKKWK